jgi:hypothetical protein
MFPIVSDCSVRTRPVVYSLLARRIDDDDDSTPRAQEFMPGVAEISSSEIGMSYIYIPMLDDTRAGVLQLLGRDLKAALVSLSTVLRAEVGSIGYSCCVVWNSLDNNANISAGLRIARHVCNSAYCTTWTTARVVL